MIVSILKSEVAYPYYPGSYTAPEYTNLQQFEQLRQVLYDGKVIECLTSLLGELLQYPLINETEGNSDQFETVLQVLDNLDFIKLCMALASTLITGQSLHEVVWTTDSQGKVVPSRVLMRDAEILRYKFVNPVVGVVPYVWVRGSEYGLGQRKFIIGKFWSIPNHDPYGNGWGEALYPLVVLRSQALQDWGKFSSTYAEPVRVGTYPVDASDDEIAAFNGFIKALGKARAVTLPEGFDVRYIDPPRSTTGLQKDLYDVINEDISLVILGESTTGKAVAGTTAKDMVSSNLRLVRAKLLGKLVTDTLNHSLVTWLKELNYPNQPTVKLKFDIPDQTPVSQPPTA